MFPEALDFGAVCEMGDGDLDEQVVAERANIEVGNDGLGIVVLEPKKFGFDLQAGLHHQAFVIEPKPLWQDQLRIAAKRFLCQQMQNRLRTTSTGLNTVVGEMRHPVILLQPGH